MENSYDVLSKAIHLGAFIHEVIHLSIAFQMGHSKLCVEEAGQSKYTSFEALAYSLAGNWSFFGATKLVYYRSSYRYLYEQRDKLAGCRWALRKMEHYKSMLACPFSFFFFSQSTSLYFSYP